MDVNGELNFLVKFKKKIGGGGPGGVGGGVGEGRFGASGFIAKF